jgi:hypothetical protein
VDDQGRELGAETKTTDPAGNPVLSRAAEAMRARMIQMIGDRYFQFYRRSGSAREAGQSDRCFDFVQASRFTDTSPETWRLAVDATEGQTDAWQAALAIMRFVHNRMAYEPQTTHVHTHAREALAAGHGVCQDFAHVMISLCRANPCPICQRLSGDATSQWDARLDGGVHSIRWLGASGSDTQYTTRRNQRADRHGAGLQRCPPSARRLSRHTGEDHGSRR